jgi:GNAT superfamily N-acetyltransferase
MTRIMPRGGWRAMTQADLETVAAIERASHAPLPPEGEVVFANRLALFPAGCFVVGDPVGGYAIAHPWAGPPPPLGAVLAALPDAPDHLWLHDLALAPALRGQGCPAAALDRLRVLARGLDLRALRLTSVHGTDAVWARHGFVAQPGLVRGYGADAVAMHLGLG